MHKLTVTNPDDGTWRVRFTNPNDLKLSVSDEMVANGSANHVRDKIHTYFRHFGGTTVTKKTYNAQDEETDGNDTPIVKAVYEIQLIRLLGAATTADMQIAKGTTKSEFVLESNVRVSDPPITGHF
jgi:hypothetical protein